MRHFGKDPDKPDYNPMRKFFCFLILHIFISHAIHAGVPQGEKDMLLELYHSTAGSQWRITWELSAPVSTWHGVGLQNGRVVSLELSDNGLKGTLPESLGGLRYLRKLDLSRNSIRGKVPKSVFRLRRLTVLNLRKNSLSGELPSIVGRLKILTFLDMSDNDLSGKLPCGLGRTKKLQWLSLSNNNLSGPVPKALGRMESLRHLEIEGNHLTGDLPQILGGLKNLQTVLLKGNALSGKIPIGLLTLPKLVRLEIKCKGFSRYELVDYASGRPDTALPDHDRGDRPKSGRFTRLGMDKEIHTERTRL